MGSGAAGSDETRDCRNLELEPAECDRLSGRDPTSAVRRHILG